MTDPAETAQPLFVERALTSATELRTGLYRDAAPRPGLRWPEQLGSLAVERLRFDPDYDAGSIVEGVKNDFSASYEMDDPKVANDVRQRSLAWLDWLSRKTNLNVYSFAYLDLATAAAGHGDAETVRQIIEDPKRLWLDKDAAVRVDDPTFGQLAALSIGTIGGKLPDIARLVAVAPVGSEAQMQAAVMPTLRDVVAEFTSRDLTRRSYAVERAGNYLLTGGTPEALEQLDRLVEVLPMTVVRLDVLAKLAEKDDKFAGAAAEAAAWHKEKTGLAEHHLAGYLKPYGVRTIINYPTRAGREDAIASRPIADIIVSQIPEEDADTSAIETSVASISQSGSGSVYDDILHCVRALTRNPHLELASPQFGFSARLEGNDERSYAHSRVTVVDANLSTGRLSIDLSSEPFRGNVAHDDVRFLCGIIQAAKNRRTGEHRGRRDYPHLGVSLYTDTYGNSPNET
ncbi:MAG TPA: hypothetical protein VFB59_02225 [Candidatus Saccharimonadales bacterium]|nr:hypothetical protein [Candidatus Saccharimonadales bacterium]